VELGTGVADLDCTANAIEGRSEQGGGLRRMDLQDREHRREVIDGQADRYGACRAAAFLDECG